MKHVIQIAFSLTLLLFWSTLVWSQSANTLSIVVTDVVSGQPVKDAFIFFSGSSVGDISDESGAVKLEPQKHLDLLVSHLNYESRVIPADSLRQRAKITITLTPKTLKIEEVTITSSASYKARRKRWLKRFESAFLGSRRDRKEVRILNPEVILFEEIEAGLRVETMDRIKIENNVLGYELSFLLDTFLLTKQGDVLYGGKVFFQDKPAFQTTDALVWEEARKQKFESSKAHFFHQLIEAKLDKEQYEVGLTQLTADLDYVGYNEIDPTTLPIIKGPGADTLFFTGFLTVTNRNIITQYGSKSVYNLKPDEYATSFLRSNSGRFIIGPSGALLNNHEVEELGYWSKQRVARLLPNNYQPKRTNTSSSTRARYLEALQDFQHTAAQEKIYLHLDKPYYSISDNLWFKAYLLDAFTHRPSTISDVLHVELIDPSGQVVQTLALHQQQFLGGDFSFRPLQKPGLYHLRAYTNNMRNNEEQYFFHRSFPVYDPVKLGDGSLSGIELLPERKNNQDHQLPFQIRIHPEGGSFVRGVENVLIIQIKDTLNEPLTVSGNIVDQSDNKIARWTTEHDGWARIILPPGSDTAHWLVVPYGAKTHRIPMPKVEATGATLHVDNTPADKVTFKVAAQPPLILDGAFLVGHTRGEVFCNVQTPGSPTEISFPRSQIPDGVASLALVDKSGTLLAKRLFFNDQASPKNTLKISTPYAFFRPRQEVIIDLSWADSLQTQGATLSVAVTDRSMVYQEQRKDNVRNYLLLQSDLPKSVDYSINDQGIKHQEEWALLDLQLAATVQERFDKNQLLHNEEGISTLPPETGGLIQGYITRKNHPDNPVKAEVLLMALHPQPVIRKVITNDDGWFQFTDLPYLDTTDYVIQAARYDPKKSTDAPVLTSTKRNVDIRLTPDALAPLDIRKNRQITTSLPDHVLQQLAYIGKENSRMDSLYGADWQIDLEEVTVSARRKVDSRNFDVFDLNRLDWVPPEKPAYRLLTTLKPGNRYIREVSRNTLQAEIVSPTGGLIRVPVTIMIDGFKATFSRFESLRANMIDYILITQTSIRVTTRSQPRSTTVEAPDGLLTVRHPGFYPGRVFPAPNYSLPKPGAEKPDLRATIHWEPTLRLDAPGKARLSFFAADTPTEYEIRVEGITDSGEPVFKTLTVTIAE